MDISSEAIHVPPSMEPSVSSAHFLATIADMSPVNASHSPEISLSVASAASAVPIEVKAISREAKKSCRLPSVVVPIPTQMLAPSRLAAEFIATSAG